MICEFCGYEFDDALGRYGCPNCLAEGLEIDMRGNIKQLLLDCITGVFMLLLVVLLTVLFAWLVSGGSL